MRQDRWLLLSWVICGGLCWNPSSAWAQDAEEASPKAPDCGTTALYYLLNSTGHATTLDQVASALPAPNPLGHSMLELKAAAHRLGLSLDGVVLQKMERNLGAPLLIFLKRDGHGHYFIARPVGHTGRLVQILDGLAPPEVIDAVDLSSSPGWTGIALAPAGPRWSMWLVGASVVGAAGLFVLAPRTARLRFRLALRALRSAGPLGSSGVT